MQVVCPCCYARHELAALVADVEARAALARLARLGGPLERYTVTYLAMFRPAKRALSWSRLTRLLDELTSALETGGIRRKGRRWELTREQWTEALRIVVERWTAGQIECPLKSHAYLFEVARGLAERAEAQAEQDVEAARRAGRGPERTGAAAQGEGYEALLDEAERLGVALDANGLVRRLPELTAAVNEARAQKEAAA